MELGLVNARRTSFFRFSSVLRLISAMRSAESAIAAPQNASLVHPIGGEVLVVCLTPLH